MTSQAKMHNCHSFMNTSHYLHIAVADESLLGRQDRARDQVHELMKLMGISSITQFAKHIGRKQSWMSRALDPGNLSEARIATLEADINSLLHNQEVVAAIQGVPAYSIHGGELTRTGQKAPNPEYVTPKSDWLAVYLGAMGWTYFSMLEPPKTLKELAAAKQFTDGPYICDLGMGIQWLFIMGVGHMKFKHLKAGREYTLSSDDIANLHILAIPQEFTDPAP